MRLSYALLSVFFASFAMAQDQEANELQLGCVQVDTNAPTVDLDPWDAWQNWCDLDTTQPEILCYQWIDDTWQETRRFDPTSILDRIEAGTRTCPSTPDAAQPLIRG